MHKWFLIHRDVWDIRSIIEALFPKFVLFCYTSLVNFCVLGRLCLFIYAIHFVYCRPSFRPWLCSVVDPMRNIFEDVCWSVCFDLASFNCRSWCSISFLSFSTSHEILILSYYECSESLYLTNICLSSLMPDISFEVCKKVNFSLTDSFVLLCIFLWFS